MALFSRYREAFPEDLAEPGVRQALARYFGSVYGYGTRQPQPGLFGPLAKIKPEGPPQRPEDFPAAAPAPFAVPLMGPQTTRRTQLFGPLANFPAMLGG